jgi:HK97 family phage prohead protease
MAGAFTQSVTERGHKIPFTTRHTDSTGKLDRAHVIARPVRWDTTDALELRAVLKFFDTPDGWDAFCRAKDGELDGGSVGFKAIEERTGPDGAREVTAARLHHVCLTSRAGGQTPAYDGPRLVEVRAAAADVAALLAVKWDPALAERDSVADELAKLGVVERS